MKAIASFEPSQAIGPQTIVYKGCYRNIHDLVQGVRTGSTAISIIGNIRRDTIFTITV